MFNFQCISIANIVTNEFVVASTGVKSWKTNRMVRTETVQNVPCNKH